MTISQATISALVRSALDEDIGSGDITADLIAADSQVQAKIIAREPGILCGQPWVDEVFRQVDDSVQLQWQLQDGAQFQPGEVLLMLTGNARSIMTAERSALNFLQTLSATATRTAEMLDLVKHTDVKLLDTRKTLPGLRQAQKYAVRIAGGQNHRMGLYDAFLIKENHIAACGGIRAAVERARQQAPELPVEVEVQTLEQLREALAINSDIIMLDNFDLEQLREAVAINAGRSRLEASGGVDADSLVKIAETGVDYISIGALTKHCRAVDLSLLLDQLA
jgi:nicotinate-nucleotide pyrophosphorylase (carboxylating)